MKHPTKKVFVMKDEHGVGEGIGAEEIGSQDIGTGAGDEYEGF